MVESFYKAFSDEFRGSESIIRERLEKYVPFVLQHKNIYPDAGILDLGCGRGEWLETLSKQNLRAIGVDKHCFISNCNISDNQFVAGDALEYLEELPSSSQKVVTAFHLIEHLPFDRLVSLIINIYRVLVPGGLCIVETPNPENLFVSTQTFYLDPTHLRPLPSQLLNFLFQQNGFEITKTLGVNHSDQNVHNNTTRLKDIFYSVSPDYAVLAHKKGSVEMLNSFNIQFDKIDKGITLFTLISSYDERIEKLEKMLFESKGFDEA